MIGTYHTRIDTLRIDDKIGDMGFGVKDVLLSVAVSYKVFLL